MDSEDDCDEARDAADGETGRGPPPWLSEGEANDCIDEDDETDDELANDAFSADDDAWNMLFPSNWPTLKCGDRCCDPLLRSDPVDSKEAEASAPALGWASCEDEDEDEDEAMAREKSAGGRRSSCEMRCCCSDCTCCKCENACKCWFRTADCDDETADWLASGSEGVAENGALVEAFHAPCCDCD